jgi:MFS family permease
MPARRLPRRLWGENKLRFSASKSTVRACRAKLRDREQRPRISRSLTNKEWTLETRSVPFVTIGSFPLLTADRRLILAASLGTIFEWYDFFLYGSLAVTISKQFFSGVDESTGFTFALLAFAAGFVVRPFGAAFFGRLGDLVGRKYTFLMTMFLMGVATLTVGLLPGYSRIGIAAPILLISLRLLQGLALGGEYGGAAVYVAEQAPADQRGYYTSWIQATATLGLLLSLAVILCCRLATKSAFDVWGWRIPFLFSSILLAVSLWIRLSMKESRAFLYAKAQGKLSRAPLKEVFAEKENLRKLLVAFGGMVAGMTVVWYTSQFYALYFLIQSLRVDPMTANLLLGTALVLGSPFIVICGRLSDRIGRKPVMLAGMLAAALTLIPLFKGLTHYANPQLATAARANPVVVAADPRTCGFQFDPLGQRKNYSDCDKVKSLLSKMGVPYTNSTLPAGSSIEIKVGSGTITGFDAKAIQSALKAATYPSRADPAQMNIGMILVLLTTLIVLVTMVYAPLAAALVEMFPTRIRYTALSVPYHAGVGWIGGLLPTIAFSLVVATGNIYYGLWYPVIVVSLSFLIGMFYVQETRGRDIQAA